MAVELYINQVGLPTGGENISRSDGLRTGLVTLTHVGPGSATFSFLWVPDDDTSAVSSLAQGSNTATFTVNTIIGGTYRIKVVVVDGTNTFTLIRLFSIRTVYAGLRLMALNEQSDYTASLVNHDEEIIDRSEFNESAVSGPFRNGNYGGWYSSFVELVKKVEALLSA